MKILTPFIIGLLATSMLFAGGCTQATRWVWSRDDAPHEVTGVAVARGNAGDALVLRTKNGRRYYVPLDASGYPPVELDASEWAGRSRATLRRDPDPFGDLATSPARVKSSARRLLEPATPARDREFADPIGLSTQKFDAGDGLVVLFYDPASVEPMVQAMQRQGVPIATNDNLLPSRAILLPKRMTASATSGALTTTGQVLATPVAVVADAASTVVLIGGGAAAGVVLAPLSGAALGILSVGWGEQLDRDRRTQKLFD